MKWYYVLILGTIGTISGAESIRPKRQSAVSPPQPGCFPAACPSDCARQFYNDPLTGCQRCRCDPNDNSNPFVFEGQFGIPTPAPPSITGQVSSCTPGDRWTDKCNSCFCPPSGVPACTLSDCTNAPPSPACRPGDNWTQDCNRCTCLNNQTVCTFQGCPAPAVERCTEGQTKRSDDGCNTCKCANGKYACTRRLCLPNQGRPVCIPNTRCPVDCPAGTVFTTDPQTGCQKCICRLNLGRPTPAGFCNSSPPCPLDCPTGTTFVTNPQTGCRSCTCGASTGIGGGPTPSLVCNPNPPCPSDCATEFVIEPLTRCRQCRCRPGSPTIAIPRPDRCVPPKCPRNCITAIVQNPQNGCDICTCNTNAQNNPFAPRPTVTACPPIACPADCTTETIRDPNTGCQSCRCRTSVAQINPFVPRPLPTGINFNSFANPFAG